MLDRSLPRDSNPHGMSARMRGPLHCPFAPRAPILRGAAAQSAPLHRRVTHLALVLPWLAVAPAVTATSAATAQQPPSGSTPAAQSQSPDPDPAQSARPAQGERAAGPAGPLRELQDFIGQWRGVGQVRRGSTRGAWQQESSWRWTFEQQPALEFKTEAGKYFRQGRLTYDPRAERFRLEAITPDGETLVYLGTRDGDQQWTLTSETDPQDSPARVQLRMVANGKRMVVLYERRVGDTRFARLSEVGYTKQGSQFGQGASYVECVVTGGLGTIPVTHQGKTYYVCCSGCRDYFNEYPDEVLAEYRQRKQQEQQDRKQKENSQDNGTK